MECQVANAHLKKMSKISSCGYITVQAFFYIRVNLNLKCVFQKAWRGGEEGKGMRKASCIDTLKALLE